MSHLPLIILGVIGIAVTLVGVVGIWRRGQATEGREFYQDSHQQVDDLYDQDDGIIAVRKQTTPAPELADLALGEQDLLHTPPSADSTSPYADDLVVVNIFPANSQAFSGFELLQAILSAGLRYGDMQIFHRYQDLNGQGPILFSLASAQAPGTFDMQKMGATTCSGLTMFMRMSFTPSVDQERFELMLNAAKQIARDIEGQLQDARHQALTPESLGAIRQRLLGQLEAYN